MWGSVLILALLTAPDALRLGSTLLLISRPRPVQNLLTYWAGAVSVSALALVGPLIVLRLAPTLNPWADAAKTPGAAADATVGRLQIGMGVLVLSIAALMTVRLAARQRALRRTPADDNTSNLVFAGKRPAGMPGALGHDDHPSSERAPTFRRLLTRANFAWESGSLWVALVMGFGSATPPLQVLVVLTSIVASGTAIATQISAAVAFIVGTLAIVEIVLVGYLVMPAKTLAVLRVLHDWLRPRRRQVLVAILAVAGVSLVVNGMAGI